MDPKKVDEAFDALVEKEGQGLFRFLCWALGREEDARDALQEVLVRIHRGLAGFRGDASLHSWAFRIATNVAHDIRGKRARAPSTYGLEAAESSPPVLHGGEVRTPDRELSDRETSERLKQALESLTPDLREPLLLHTVSGMKYREVADALGLPIGTVTSRIHAARMKLQELLGDDL